MSYKAEVARALRKRQTRAEIVLWDCLRNRKLGGYKFRRQFPAQGCVFDFFCYQKGLVIEADGEIHAKQQESDEGRDMHAKQCGITVLRFTNDEILKNTTMVVHNINALLNVLPNYTVPMDRLR